MSAKTDYAALAHAYGDEGDDDQPLSGIPLWPAPMAAEAFPGLVGDIIGTIGPETEADPAALLAHLLVMFGSCVGRAPFFAVEGTRHYPNLFALCVGPTGKGRKGTAEGQLRRLFHDVDEGWERHCVRAGLVSGEGLIWNVRDAIKQTKVKGRVPTQVVVDTGVTDKRLLVIETEFAGTLRAMGRKDSTLGSTVRQAWDRGDLATLGKQSPARATGAHISIIGHITIEELRAELRATDAANGFLNRHLIFLVRRARMLPEGGHVDEQALAVVVRELRAAVHDARRRNAVCRDDFTRQLWAAVYPELSEGRPGLVGAVLGRAEAQVVRLSLVYALLDRSPMIAERHLAAALEVWRYCEASARFIFGDRLGDPLADKIEQMLPTAPEPGMTRSQLYAALGRHTNRADMEAALRLLAGHGRAEQEILETGGRPAELWRRCAKSALSEKSLERTGDKALFALNAHPNREATNPLPSQSRSEVEHEQAHDLPEEVSRQWAALPLPQESPDEDQPEDAVDVPSNGPEDREPLDSLGSALHTLDSAGWDAANDAGAGLLAKLDVRGSVEEST